MNYNKLLKSGILENDFFKVKEAVDNGADVNHINNIFNINFLMDSINRNNDINIVNYLLDNGADISQITKSGQTAFSISCRNANLDIIKILVERGADINTCTNFGDYPIHEFLSSYRSNREINIKTFEYLISIGMSVYVMDINNTSLLTYAIICDRYEIFKLLIHKYNLDVNHINSNGYTPLMSVVHEFLGLEPDSDKYISYLISNGADYTIKGKDGTMLDLAKKYNKLEIIEYIEDLEYSTIKHRKIINDFLKKEG